MQSKIKYNVCVDKFMQKNLRIMYVSTIVNILKKKEKKIHCNKLQHMKSIKIKTSFISNNT